MFDLIPFGRNERNLFRYLDNVEKSLFDGLDTRVSRFRTDILDKGDRYLLEAELPGFKKEDIHLDLEGDILTIRAEHTEEKEDKDGPSHAALMSPASKRTRSVRPMRTAY